MKRLLSFLLTLCLLLTPMALADDVEAVSEGSASTEEVAFDLYEEETPEETGAFDIVSKDLGIAIDATLFPDANLLNWVKETVDTDKTGSLSTDEIASVTSIDLSELGISSLDGLEIFSSLQTLMANTNNITQFDASRFPALQQLYLGDNPLTSLNVSNNPDLTRLVVFDTALSQLDLSGNPKLESLFAEGSKLADLILKGNDALRMLDLTGNNLTSLDLSSVPALTDLFCNNNKLTSLDLSALTSLDSLMCQNNNLTSLDLSNNALLQTFYCYGNDIPTLNINENPLLMQAFNEGTFKVRDDGSYMYDHIFEVIGDYINSATLEINPDTMVLFGDLLATVVELPTTKKYTANLGEKFKVKIADGRKIKKIDIPSQYGTADPSTGAVTITATKTGKCKVTVTLESGKKLKLSLTLVDPKVPASFEIDPAPGIDAKGNLTRDLLDGDLQLSILKKSFFADYSAVWSSSNRKIATVDPSTGLVKFHSAGKVTITAKSTKNKRLKARVVIRVKDSTIPEALPIDLTDLEVVGKNTVKVSAASGPIQLRIIKLNPAADTTATWRSSQNKVVKVDPDIGLLTFTGKPGKATITATSEKDSKIRTKLIVIVE